MIIEGEDELRVPPVGPERRRITMAVFLALSLAVVGRGKAQTRIGYNNQQLFLSGSNIAWVNFARDLGPPAIDTVAFRTVFDSLHAHGGNALRFWLHTTGQYTPQFSAGGAVTGPGTNAIADLKRILDMAWQRRIGLVLCLWSFDMMVITNGSTVTDRSALMLTDTAYTHAYITNALIPMVNGVRGHPGIIAWEVFNEAEGMSDEFGWSTTYHVPMSDIQRFVNLCAGAIHRTDSTAQVTTGAWALTAETDVTLLARRVDLQAEAMTADDRRKMEDDFAAHYRFRVSAAEILSKLALASYNYYRDDRLAAAGGDPQGTLDFYTDHYYDWQGTPLSPFHHPYRVWNLTKPLVIAEFFPEQTLDLPFTALYDTLFANGYAGALSWGWYSGAAGHPQATLQANTMTLAGELFSRHPEEIDPDPLAGRIYSFTASATSIGSGDPVTLRWRTSHGSVAALNDSLVRQSDSLTVRPVSPVTYRLTASGTVRDTAIIQITPLDTNNPGGGLPDRFALSQNYPNPFNPSTTIAFALPAEADVTLRIYTVLGEEVATLVSGRMNAGYHAVSWNAHAASGMYLCRMAASPAGNPGSRFRRTLKLMLVR